MRKLMRICLYEGLIWLTADEKEITEKIPLRHLFRIFLKTGRRRVTLSIISGALVFLTITSLIMVVYSHRFSLFQENQIEEYNWFNDGIISVGTNAYMNQPFYVENDTIARFIGEFQNLTKSYIPDLGMDNYTAAISTMMYTYGDPWIPDNYYIQEFMTVTDDVYEVVSGALVEGRLPRNDSELLCFKRATSEMNLSDTVEFYKIQERNLPRRNYTIVGIVDNLEEAFTNASLSTDILDWEFDVVGYSDIYGVDNSAKRNTFFMNFTQYQSIFISSTFYGGYLAYLLDVSYDTTELRLNKVSDYVKNFPDVGNLPELEFFDRGIIVAPDLYVLLEGFASGWVVNITQILSMNSTLIFLIGLILVVTLTIGSKGLEQAFRRLKLYGLSYNITLRLILLENLLLTSTSFILGTLLGIGTGALFNRNLVNRPSNFYSNFLSEPLFIASIIAFIGGFFLLSFFIQNSIARKTTRIVSEEYKRKRGRVQALFSSNEFRMFVFGLLFTILSLAMYVFYRYVGSALVYSSALTFITFMWFMISCSVAFLMTFLLLLLARLLTLLWSLLSQRLWKRNLNLFSLSIKHLTVNRGNYQLAIMAALVFGLVVVPGLTSNQYISNNLQKDADLQMGSTAIMVPHWVDPSDELDSLFTNITEIEAFAEVTFYELINYDPGPGYPSAFYVSMIGLEDPLNFTQVIDSTLLNTSKLTIEDIILLENETNLMINGKHAKDQKVSVGGIFGTDHFTRYPENYTIVGTYDFFPLLPLAKKALFSNLDVFTIVGTRETIRDIASAVDVIDTDTEVTSNTMKLLKPVNESVIPLIKQQIEDQGYETLTYNEVYSELISQVNQFSNKNLRFFALLASVILVLVGFYTGVTIYDERRRIMDSLYRTGAVRGQILGIYTLEMTLVTLIPITVTLLASILLIKFIATFFLGVQSNYYPFKPEVSWWLILLLIFGGLALSLIGWFATIAPAIYRYRPVKQE
jgi:MFS family permease